MSQTASRDDDILEDLLSWSPSGSGRGLSTPSQPLNVTANSGAAPSPPKAGEGPPVEEEEPLDVAPEMWEKLFPHQREGIEWLYLKHRKARACLLADEMGLGKTIQVSVFLGALFRMRKARSCVVVAPPTLLPMWEGALLQWGGLKHPVVQIIRGERREQRQAKWASLKSGIPRVLLTSYGVLREDATALNACFLDYCVLDEAHAIKDSHTRSHRSAMLLSARHKVALTGTPVMNSFEDMWSIFRFLDGSIMNLSFADFRKRNRAILRGNERGAAAASRSEAEEELASLQAAIRPFMLRREKQALGVVASTKRDNVLWVRLSPLQRRQYRAFLDSAEVRDAAGVTATTSSADRSSGGPLVLLTMLMQICNHPWLCLGEDGFAEAMRRPYEALSDDIGDIHGGTKMAVALALLQGMVAEGRKSLVFSRSKRLLHMLARLLSDAGIRFSRIDGDTTAEQRFAHVREFNERAELSVCLLTTQVGGVGLTLDGATCVLLLDPSWNPSADAQAIDRVHRIGQTRDVDVYRFVTCGTVEEKIYRNQVFKTMAAKQAAMPPEQQSHLFRYFTHTQLRSMFTLGDLDAGETAAQLEELHPGRVDSALRAAARAIDGVVDLSDNSCVLNERVAAAAAADDADDADGDQPDWEVLGADPSPAGRRRPRGRSASSPAPRPRARRDPALSQEEVSSLLQEVSTVSTASAAAPPGSASPPPARPDESELMAEATVLEVEEPAAELLLRAVEEAPAPAPVLPLRETEVVVPTPPTPPHAESVVASPSPVPDLHPRETAETAPTPRQNTWTAAFRGLARAFKGGATRPESE